MTTGAKFSYKNGILVQDGLDTLAGIRPPGPGFCINCGEYTYDLTKHYSTYVGYMCMAHALPNGQDPRPQTINGWLELGTVSNISMTVSMAVMAWPTDNPDASNIDLTGIPISWLWGDGGRPALIDGGQPVATHTYAVPGTYVVSVSAPPFTPASTGIRVAPATRLFGDGKFGSGQFGDTWR